MLSPFRHCAPIIDQREQPPENIKHTTASRWQRATYNNIHTHAYRYLHVHAHEWMKALTFPPLRQIIDQQREQTPEHKYTTAPRWQRANIYTTNYMHTHTTPTCTCTYAMHMHMHDAHALTFPPLRANHRRAERTASGEHQNTTASRWQWAKIYIHIHTHTYTNMYRYMYHVQAQAHAHAHAHAHAQLNFEVR